MALRAEPSGRRLTQKDASLVRGMAARGDRHHDIAAWFGVNQGRIAEVMKGEKFPNAPVAPAGELPPPGPYSSGEATQKAIDTLQEAKAALEKAGDKETAMKVAAALKDIQKRR